MPAIAEQLAKFLETFGGWGVSVVLLGGIVYLYRSTNRLLEKRNEQFIEALTETTKTLQQSNDESRRTEEVLQRVNTVLERVDRRLDR